MRHAKHLIVPIACCLLAIAFIGGSKPTTKPSKDGKPAKKEAPAVEWHSVLDTTGRMANSDMDEFTFESKTPKYRITVTTQTNNPHSSRLRRLVLLEHADNPGRRGWFQLAVLSSGNGELNYQQILVNGLDEDGNPRQLKLDLHGTDMQYHVKVEDQWKPEEKDPE